MGGVVSLDESTAPYTKSNLHRQVNGQANNRSKSSTNFMKKVQPGLVVGIVEVMVKLNHVGPSDGNL